MKERFLNLNTAGSKIVAVLFVLLVAIPGGGWILERVGVHAAALRWVVRGSLGAGAALLLIFTALVILEQILDARLTHAYRKTLGRRIPLADGYAECPNCGYRRVQGFDRACPACGKDLA